MQGRMPQHLQKYQSSGGYVPERVQREMTDYMQKSLPSHMKQYAGAYVEQNVVLPSLAGAGGRKPVVNSAAMSGQGPRPNFGPQSQPLTSPVPKQAMFQNDRQAPLVGARLPVTGAQPNLAQPQLPATQPFGQAPSLAQQPPQQPQIVTPSQPQSPVAPQPQQPGQTWSTQAAPPPPPQHGEYEFIMSPNAAESKKPLIPVNGSPLVKLALGGVGLILLFIVFSVVRGLLSGPSPYPSYAGIAQDQQNLIHLTTNALDQQSLSTGNRQFAATAKVSLISAQKDMLKYLEKNKYKINDKQLELGISSATDKRLETAAAATTYNSTFNEIVKDELTDYKSHLQQTFQKYEIKNGRALLSENYKQADLLIKQLDKANPAN